MKKALYVIIFLIGNCFVFGQAPKVTKYFEWYKKNYMIQNPVFAHSNAEILFVSQFNIPDGHSGEGREEYVDSLLAKAEKEERFADPMVCILNLKTKKLAQIDYGWTPDFSPNDKQVAYSYQAMPISGKRVLAETLNGNQIKIYNRVTKQYEMIAQPNETFLLDPVFIDSSTVIYKTGDAVNGAYGGGVGINKISLVTKKTDTIFPVTKNHGLFNLVGDVYQRNNRVCYMAYIPQDSGEWMANNYAHLLLCSTDTLHDFGKGSFNSYEGKYAIEKDGSLILIDDASDLTAGKRFLIKYKGNKVVSKRELTFECGQETLSPNGKYLLYYDYNYHVFLVNTTTFKKVRLPLHESEIYAMVWSEKCDKLAIVQGHTKLPDTDMITLFYMK